MNNDEKKCKDCIQNITIGVLQKSVGYLTSDGKNNAGANLGVIKKQLAILDYCPVASMIRKEIESFESKFLTSSLGISVEGNIHLTAITEQLNLFMKEIQKEI